MLRYSVTAAFDGLIFGLATRMSRLLNGAGIKNVSLKRRDRRLSSVPESCLIYNIHILYEPGYALLIDIRLI
jgi:hypothetical protein